MSYAASLSAVLVSSQPDLPLGHTNSCVGLTEKAAQGTSAQGKVKTEDISFRCFKK